MGTVITYRDLPGGPMKIKFADEISRHCLCRQCHMLSLRMYSDSATHMFCDDCLNDQSYKHKKYEIYCPDERKDVSLAQMYQARDLVTVLCDQYVECPNQPKCTVKLPLGQLEKHYIECKEMSSIKCTKCGQKVPSTSWMQHKTDCQPTCDNELPRKKADHRDGKRKSPPASSARLPVSVSRKSGSAQNTTAAPSALYPSNLLPDAATGEFNQQFQSLGSASTSTQPPVKSQGPASIDPEITTCKHCGRNVKESNMPRHLEKCYEVRDPCPYCDENVARKDMKAHTEKCMRKFEEAREASDAAAAASGNSKKSKTSMTLEAKGTTTETTSHTEQELQLRSGWSTDVNAWLPNATAGNWYAAYVAMEEQFKDTGTDQAARHAHFVPKLVALKQDHFVRDFIDAPYEPQPFDCLIAALFVRACLPFNLWPQGFKKVTWEDVLEYLPKVLYSRLSLGAKLYLQKHPVIFKDNGYHRVDEVGTVAANALMPGHTLSVTSSDPVTTETEALAVPEVDMRDVAGAQKQELGPPQVFGKEEEPQHSKKSRKYGLVASEQESNRTFHNTSPSDHLGPSADESMNSRAATKARSHSTADTEPCRMTCEEAFKESNPMPTITGAFNHDRDDWQESCHRKSGSCEVSETCPCQTRSSICEDKPAYSAVSEDRKINPRSVTGHMPEGVPSSHQLNKGFPFETTEEDSKPKYVAGSPQPSSVTEEVPPTLLNLQHEQSEIIQADALGSANMKYEESRGISSQNSRIGHFREKGGCLKTHDETQQELSEGTNERQCDETERSVSGLDSDLVSSEQKSSTAFQNATPAHPSGPSADEPTQYLAATKASSHSTGGKKPFFMTSAEALKESIPTPGTSGAFNDDPDDDQKSCHLKSGNYEVNEACSYKTRSSICEGKPAYYAAAENSNIDPRSFAGHLAGGVPSSHQLNQSFCFESTKEDSKPNYFTGSPVSGSLNEEIPPTLLNAQHEQYEIIQADAPGSSNTKYEMSQGISSRNSRIEPFREKGWYVKTPDQTQELSEGTYARRCNESERSVSGLDSGLVSSEQKSNTAFQSAPPSHPSGPSADEPMKYPAATKASTHSSGDKEPYRMTCAEAIKESNQALATTGAFNDDLGDGQESCHLNSESYEVSDTCSYKARSSIWEGKPAYCASAEDSNINPRSFAGHLAGGVPSSHQPNKGVSFETTKEDSKPNYSTGSPLPASFSKEVPPTLLNAQHEENEIIQADALGSANTKYEVSRGISSQNSRIGHFREKGGCVKTHDQIQQELSEGTNERLCDETERSVSGLGSDLVSPEQKSCTAFQNATPSHHSGPSADEPVSSPASSPASSHSTGGKEPRQMTFAEVVKKSYATHTATAALIHDRDDGQKSYHHKHEAKPAHSAVSEDRKIFSNIIAGHTDGGALLCGQPNKGFSTETTDDDSKPKRVTDTPLPCSSSGEVPPTPLTLQHQQNEILQADHLRSSSTKYERSRGRSSQNARIFSNSSMTQKHDNIGVRKEHRAGMTNTETQCTSRKAVASLSHPEPKEKLPVGTISAANVNLEMKSTDRHRTADFPKRSDFYSCASCKDSWEENDDHLKPKASKHCYESRSNNQKPSQDSRNRCPNSEFSQAWDEDKAKVEKSACGETDTNATAQDSTHKKNYVDSTAPAAEFEASAYDQLKPKGTSRLKFQRNIPCSLQLTWYGDTFADLHRADTEQYSSQELYSQTADSSMNVCSRILEPEQQIVNDVANNQENSFSASLSSLETEV
ncbi:mucin-12-like isoform X3 [Dermacentor albipictus]|uniref:mucin-12-like isoform X3 n=1 Tax=Dermacentor albipictus TaxID=60249 RepID=UPI0038FCB119